MKILPCTCGYAGKLEVEYLFFFYRVQCPECSRAENAYSPKELIEKWNGEPV